MDVEFAVLELRISREILDGGDDGVSDLDQVTDSYISLVRKYREELGDEEARRRLADTASEVQQWCPLCADKLDRARETL